MALSRSTTWTASGARRSKQAFPEDRTAISSTARCPTTAGAPAPRMFRFQFSCYYLFIFFKFCRSFAIASDGSLAVTVDAHQAIAVHTGALGSGTSEPRTAELVPVLFNVNAMTTFGEVGLLLPGVSSLGIDCLRGTRTSSSWAACRGLETWIRPTRYVCSISLGFEDHF